jgi:hypothetical protein
MMWMYKIHTFSPGHLDLPRSPPPLPTFVWPSFGDDKKLPQIATMSLQFDHIKLFGEMFNHIYEHYSRFPESAPAEFQTLKKQSSTLVKNRQLKPNMRKGWIFNKLCPGKSNLLSTEKQMEDEKYTAIFDQYCKFPTLAPRKFRKLLHKEEKHCGKLMKHGRSWLYRQFCKLVSSENNPDAAPPPAPPPAPPTAEVIARNKEMDELGRMVFQGMRLDQMYELYHKEPNSAPQLVTIVMEAEKKEKEKAAIPHNDKAFFFNMFIKEAEQAGLCLEKPLSMVPLSLPAHSTAASATVKCCMERRRRSQDG